MQSPHIQALKNFDGSHIPDLDVAVLGALELFQTTTLPSMDFSAYARPLVVGSGNAEATGRILFEKADAIFASESTYEGKLKSIHTIDGVILISASGSKHAPHIAKTVKKCHQRVVLITNTQNSPAAQELDLSQDDKEYVFPKNREPYTYNTSTYMGMLLGATGENPADIQRFIEQRIITLALPDFSRYNKCYLIVPSCFAGIIRMLEIKFIELFGRRVARDVETSEYVRHATTIVPSDELFISFGEKNTLWGTPPQRLNVPLPKDAGYAAIMAIGYYIIGQIQKKHPPYFKNNIVKYTKEISKIFGETIRPIVEPA